MGGFDRDPFSILNPFDLIDPRPADDADFWFHAQTPEGVGAKFRGGGRGCPDLDGF